MKESNHYLTYKSNSLTTRKITGKASTLWPLSMSAGSAKMSSKENKAACLTFNTTPKLFRCYSNTAYKLRLYKETRQDAN